MNGGIIPIVRAPPPGPADHARRKREAEEAKAWRRLCRAGGALVAPNTDADAEPTTPEPPPAEQLALDLE